MQQPVFIEDLTPVPTTPEVAGPELPTTPDGPAGPSDLGSGDGTGGGKGKGHGPGDGPGDGEGTYGDSSGREDFSDTDPRPVTFDVEAPVLLHRVEPEYPEVARRARIEGDVILEAVIGIDGKVESVKVLRSQPLLDGSAIRAVSQWIYRPARQNGRAVKVYVSVFIKFRLN